MFIIYDIYNIYLEGCLPFFAKKNKHLRYALDQRWFHRDPPSLQLQRLIRSWNLDKMMRGAPSPGVDFIGGSRCNAALVFPPTPWEKSMENPKSF